jgi:3'-phosphoadenosine 5'-phosphosulfate (PAPS) 3'-phosphatase
LKNDTYTKELDVAIRAARRAGTAVLDLYDRSAAETYIKGDGSPVTDADLASDRIIREILGAAFPNDAILTEEGADHAERLTSDRLWIVDPIDGTQQFVNRTGEFDVLIALVVDGEPVVGVLLQPTTGRYLAAAAGSGAFLGHGDHLSRCRFNQVEGATAPRLQTSTWLNVPQSLPGLGRIANRLGSPEPTITSCGIVPRHLLPPGNQVDVLIGLPTTIDQTMAWEWDFASADIVVREAGGCFTDVRGSRVLRARRALEQFGCGLVRDHRQPIECPLQKRRGDIRGLRSLQRLSEDCRLRCAGDDQHDVSRFQQGAHSDTDRPGRNVSSVEIASGLFNRLRSELKNART